jgi:cytochrome c-type biogenesis protein CcmF
LGWKRRRSYGALLVHLGLAILIIGLAGSWAYKESVPGQLGSGQSLTLGGIQVTFDRLEGGQEPDKVVTTAVLDLTVDGKRAGTLRPSLEYYPATDVTWTRVAVRSSVSGDIYVVLEGATPADRTVNVRLEVHPVIDWLWVGGAIMALGGLVALVLGHRPSGPKNGQAGKAGKAAGSGPRE